MRLLTCVLVVFMLVGAASAASPVPTSKGDKAMIFTFYGLDDLELDGYWGGWGVGMRYYISDLNALRAGVVFGNDSWTQKALDEDQDDLEHKESEIGLSLTYERHLEAPCKSVSPYLGAGFGYWRWTRETPYYTRAYDKDVEEETALDLHAVAGFEWGFTDCMTLGGEYALGFVSGSWKEELDSGGDTTTLDEEEFSFMGFSTQSVFLSVYW